MNNRNMIVVNDNSKTIAVVMPRERIEEVEETVFVSTPQSFLQFGFVVKPTGTTVPVHHHVNTFKDLEDLKPSEIWVILSGSGNLKIKNNNIEHLISIEKGDIIMLLDCTAGIENIDNLKLFECRVGKYTEDTKVIDD